MLRSPRQSWRSHFFICVFPCFLCANIVTSVLRFQRLDFTVILPAADAKLSVYSLLMLPAQYAERGLCNDRASVCLSHRSTLASAAGGLLLSALWAGYRSIAAGAVLQCRHRRSAANAGSVMLRADGGGSATCYLCCRCLLVLSVVFAYVSVSTSEYPTKL